MTESNLEPINDALLKRSDRVSYPSDRYYNFLVRDGDPIELDENNEDQIISECRRFHAYILKFFE